MAVESRVCNTCGAEFDVVHTEKDGIEFCPFCGTELLDEEDPFDDEDCPYDEDDEEL
jgi:rRNA maturation endonuclease Nob1